MHTNRNRFYALDLLRFTAAFAVVLYHLTARPEGGFDSLESVTRFGYLGVPVFFMISGFVIALSARNRSAYEFGLSRAARLYPALWVAIPFTVGICYLLKDGEYNGMQLLTNALLVNNYLGQPNVDGVYWTLQAELKFYACTFVLVALGLFSRYQLWLTAWLTLSALHFFTGETGPMSWFISPSWSPYFITGVAIYLMRVQGVTLYNGFVFVSALLMAAGHSFQVAERFISDVGLLEGLVAAGTVVAFASLLVMIALDRINIAGGSNVVLMGALTYPLYLVHNEAGKAIIDGLLPYLPEWLAVLLAIGLVSAAAFVVCRFIEPPASRQFKRVGLAARELIPLAFTPGRASN